MFYVGIDIAKRSHEAVVLDEGGNVIQKAFSFSNSCTGFNTLLDYLRRITRTKPQFVFGMESTSHYWLPLFTRLKKEGYAVHVINPIQSHALRGLYIRKLKTDDRDSKIIADLIRFGRYSETQVPQEKRFALREMCRNRFYLVDSASDLKRKATALIDQVFPEYNTLFSGVFLVSSVELLLKYPTPDIIGRAHLDTITSLLLRSSGGHFGKGKAMEIKEATKNTFGVPDSCGAYAELIRVFLAQIRFIQKQVAALDEKIDAIMAELNTQITSIAGVGSVLGAAILSEIGDISRFKSSDKLAAFAGIDPSVRQSGDFSSTKNHMSKRGSPYLRRAIWMASTVAVKYDPIFKAYYDKKAAEGMKYMKIIGHCTKKMASVIFAVLRDDKAYTPVLNLPISA